MPPETVDVNVHPTKLEVRFQDSGRLYSQLLGTIRKKFLATDLTARVQVPPGVAALAGAVAGSLDAAGDMGVDANQSAQHRAELVAWAQGQLPGPEALKPQDPQGELELTYDTSAHAPLTLNRLDRDWTPRGGHYRSEFENASPPLAASSATATAPPMTSTALREPPVVSRSPSAAQAIQLHNRYLITETDEGMIVIDQHALHERILYEQLRSKINDGALETQRLLVPEPVTLTPAEAAVALDAAEALAQIGIEVEPFGGDTVLVSTYPAMLANLNPSELLRQVVDQLMEGEKQPERRDLLDSLLHMISCKAAVKAGDRLTPEEITALLEQRSLFADSHHCPHGRPTSLVFTREELDRRFKRI
jgi:DNA mismatch repair protein MutL